MENKNIGIVQNISGQSLVKLVFEGKTAHAVEKWGRRNSLLSASDFISQSKVLSLACKDVHITIGNITNYPNLTNVVSNKTIIQVDVRHVSNEIRGDIVRKIIDLAEGISSIHDVDCSFETINRKSSKTNEEINTIMKSVLTDNGIKHKFLDSYAGHDAVILSEVVPTCLVFLRDRKGISHHPEESICPCGLEDGFRFFNACLTFLKTTKNIKD